MTASRSIQLLPTRVMTYMTKREALLPKDVAKDLGTTNLVASIWLCKNA